MRQPVTLSRSFDAEAANRLVNDPAVRPHVGGDPAVALDLTTAVDDRDNHLLVGDHGGFLFAWTSPAIYEAHTFILPGGRGAWAYGAARAALDHMAAHGAAIVWTRVAPDAAHVRAFTLRAGFVPVGHRKCDLGAGPVNYDTFEWRP
jgi:hypothetical protein